MEKGRLNVMVLRVVRVIISGAPSYQSIGCAPLLRTIDLSLVQVRCASSPLQSSDRPDGPKSDRQSSSRPPRSLPAARELARRLRKPFLAPGRRSSLAVSVSEKSHSPERYWCV